MQAHHPLNHTAIKTKQPIRTAIVVGHRFPFYSIKRPKIWYRAAKKDMPISIRKAVAADIPVMAALDVAGYGRSPFRHAMFPPERRVKPGDGDAREWFERGARRALDSSPATHYIVAVEDGGEGSPAETVVGMAIWGSPRTAAADAGQHKGASNNTTQEAEARPSGRPPGLPLYIGYEAVMEANEEIQTMLDSQDTLDEKTRSNMWSMPFLSFRNF